MRPEELLDRYAAAARAKDVESFLDLYADDVRSFDLWGAWSYDGKDALRAVVTEWFRSVDTDTIGVDFDEIRSEIGEDVAGVSAFTTFRGISAEGEELRSMDNRLTWILRRDGVGWKIVHEHTSAPVGEEGTVNLRRA
jgi:uncharacterized protein (TIGR02246 family)